MITESRLRTGKLTFGPPETPVVFACQATAVTVTPSYDDDGDPLETLCGDTIAAGKKASYTIAGTSVQDFDNPQGFLSYCWNTQMQQVAFTWQANPSAPTWAGNCVILALPEGGEVNTRLTTDWEFEIVGSPYRAYAWAANTAYAAGTDIRLSGGQILDATVAGTSGATEPAPPAAVGDTVVDGTVTWTRTA